jgi:hypothetical protein
MMLARIAARVIHAVRTELRKLEPADPMPRYDTTSTIGGQADMAGQWDHDTRAPVQAFGFGPSMTTAVREAVHDK